MPNIMVDWTWTPVSIVATYAAFIGSLSLLINFFAYRRDNPDIRLKLHYSLIVPGPGQTLGPFYSFDIDNIGRRTVTITGFGYFAGRMLLQVTPYNPLMPLLSSQELPFELAEGKNKTLFVVRDMTFKNVRETISSPPQKAYVRDAVGHRFVCRVPTRMRDEIWGDTGYRPWWKPWEQGWWPI